jgi:hypothetical protein
MLRRDDDVKIKGIGRRTFLELAQLSGMDESTMILELWLEFMTIRQEPLEPGPRREVSGEDSRSRHRFGRHVSLDW